MAELNHDTLDVLRKGHPGWRLLCSDHSFLVVAFLNRTFINPNVHIISESDLSEALEDELFALRERLDPDNFPRAARDYLND